LDAIIIRMTHTGLNAHLLASEPGYRAAGIHNYIQQLLTHLAAVAPDDWRFTAMVGANHPAQFPGVTMHHAAWNTDAPIKRIAWEQFVQPRHLRQFDLYHAMAFAGPLIQPAPMVVTVYDLTFMRFPEQLPTLRRVYLEAMTALTCRRARRVLAISESTKHDLTAFLGVQPDKIDVTPLGYDRATYRPLPDDEVAAFKQSHDLPERFWLFLGTLEPRKNLVTLIEAYAALDDDERLPLILAGGKGWQTDEIFDTIDEHNLGDRIQAVGFVPDDEIALWYNAAEVFVYPSLFEGFGLPVLEAMACGTPVVTSNVSSLPEVAEGAGMCLPPGDIITWEEALRRVATDATWRNEAREAGLQKAQQFTWERTAELTIASYQRALSD
jgi:glycosyltransferase involved in cell wall biosynthesis